MADNDTEQSTAWQQDPFAAAYPETGEFWAAAAQGRFLLRTCTDCGKAHWHPRVVCPLCGSQRLEWKQASGRGTLYAFSPARRADPPYLLAYVTLEEGPTLMTNIVDARYEDLRIGQAVGVQFRPAAEGRMMPFFAVT
ncbi:MAG: OB-fold domain-containing protein [Pseudomonadota bacterium]|nr:OB-fold domain-containing protein [Pseudomonadota bacterium]